jgi:hypothetical protein
MAIISKRDNSRAAKHAEFLKKYGKPDATAKAKIAKGLGIFKDNPLNFEEIRKKAWSRK